MVVGLTNAALWALEATADEKDTDVEVFSNVGFYSRPPADSDAEAVVVKMGGSSRHSAIIATRDEKVRQAIAAAKDLAEDETILFNSTGALIHLKADGSVEVQAKAGAKIFARTAGGGADDVVLRSEFLIHFHPTAATGATSGPATAGGTGPVTPGVPADFSTTVLQTEDD